MVTQLSATSWEVEVETGAISTISSGVSVNTIRKIGGGQLNLTGTGYSVDFIEVADGQVYVHDAAGLYLRQPVWLTAGIYPAKETHFYVEVAAGESATVSAPIIVAVLHKTGDGTVDFNCLGTRVDYLKIEAGRVITDNTDLIPLLGLDLGGILSVTTDITVPDVALTANGTIESTNDITLTSLVLAGYTLTTNAGGKTILTQLDTTTTGGTISNADELTLNGAVGTNLLTKIGAGTMQVPANLSGASVPVTVNEGAMRVSGSGRLPTAAMTIGAISTAGAIFQLSESAVPTVPTAGAVPGAMVVQQYGILSVDAGLAVPADSDAGDVFTGTLKFNSGSVLKLGDGSSWARDMTIGAAL